ncbi:MAG: SDR family NAD(P)-dependent oxidoreductase [Acidimicrobiales bacterium]
MSPPVTVADLPLHGVGVLVTGGGSGIGLAVARRLATQGAAVTICGRDEEKLAAAVADAGLRDAGGSVAYTVADVTSEADVAGAVAAAEDRAGGPLGAVVPMPAATNLSVR